MKKHLLFLGAPGAGKGTQAELLSKTNSLLHLSTGELLRKEIEMDSLLGREVKNIINRGELVNDDLVLKIVRQNLDKNNNGWILDGYPRNLSQANSLNEVLIEINQPLEVVFYLNIPEEVLIKRLLLRGRKDDTEETIRTRLEIYKKTTEPLIQYFKDLSLLEYIDADRDLKIISSEIKQKMSSS
jgi:adenylate kinase